MERLITDAGGRPVKNEDFLEYLQTFIIFELWFADLGLSDCIVYGVDITGSVGNYNISAGVIYYNNELRILDAQVGVALPLVLEPEDVDINLREYDDTVSRYTAQIFKMIPNVGGSFSLDLDTERTGDILFPVKPKIIDIGDWDMDTVVTVSVAHGLDYTKIRNVSVTIRQDTGFVNTYDINRASSDGTLAGHITWDNTNIILIRRNGGAFDATNFNETSYNRGWITIEYIK